MMIHTYKRAQHYIPQFASNDDKQTRSLAIRAKLDRVDKSGMGFKQRLAAVQAVSVKNAIVKHWSK